ncbi:putative metal homeostasis protein [Aerococcaceae bacterium zg-ZJ1578]|nr:MULTISPECIES: putative metal homeostasis protein [unclassified Facklamia]MBK0347128.1 putative metal homeostasis protein [Aerococcaceae bacterium zg-1578]MBR7927601.1 putative metal homeostasis protein [Aerococcaceae bacterium zg-ZUI334]MBS4462153.1 putative metal homeostasis protein [Aerococcaceae bacterium zg-B36]QQD65424.1 putative metal homeostasis protein [Aerococcaceae bacterium zg-252]
MTAMNTSNAYRYLDSPNIKTRKRARRVIKEAKRNKKGIR